MNEKGRTIFYGIAGAYLIYLAYDMFQSKAATQDMKLLIFCVIFGIAGVLLLLAAGKSYKKYMTDAMEDKPDAQEITAAEAEDKTEEAGGDALPEKKI